MIIQLADSPIDRVSSQALLIFFHQNERPLTGHTGVIDWQMNGRLSSLVASNRIRGIKGEVLLMPADERISSDLIFLFGMGNKTSSPINLKCKIRQTLSKLKIKKIAVSLLSSKATELAFWRKLGEDVGLEELLFIPPYSANSIMCDKLKRALTAGKF